MSADFVSGDDMMAMADATGVNAMPTHRGPLSDDGLRAILTAWSTAAAGDLPDVADVPVPYVLTDHGVCESPWCDEAVCMCAEPCTGISERLCLHNLVLCDACRLECPDCLDDYRQDGA